MPADGGGFMTVNVNSFRDPPPLDTNLRLATRAGEKCSADMRETKNVGGPIMNVTCSRSIRSKTVGTSKTACGMIVAPRSKQAMIPAL